MNNPKLFRAAVLLALLLGITSTIWSGYASWKACKVKGFDEKVKEAAKLENRVKVLTRAVEDLMAQRDGARSELMVTTAAIAAGKIYNNKNGAWQAAEADPTPVSNISTQVIVLELHVNK